MKDCLTLVMDVGEQMLLCGAEVHRVEDSVSRMCAALGAVRVDCFIITSSMVVTLHEADGSIYTETRRIRATGTNFHQLERLNALSRRVCAEHPCKESIKEELAQIKSTKTYPFAVECLMYAVIAAAFTVFFGGGLAESLLAALIGLVVRFAVALSAKIIGNAIFSKFCLLLSSQRFLISLSPCGQFLPPTI